MSIEFELLGADLDDCIVNGSFAFSMVSLGFTLDADDSAVLGSFIYFGAALAEDSDEYFEAESAALVDGYFIADVIAAGFDIDFAEVDGSFYLGGFATDVEDDSSVAIGSFLLAGAAAEFGTITAYGFFVEEPMMMVGYGGTSFHILESDFHAETEVSEFITLVVDSIARFEDSTGVLAKLETLIADSVVVRDFLTVVMLGEVEESLVITDLTTGQLRIIAMVADQLMIADEALSHLSALVTVASALVLRDVFVPGRDGMVDASLVITDEVTSRVNALVEVLSALVVEDEVEFSATVFGLVTSDVMVLDDSSVTVAMMVELLESFSLGVRFTVGDDTYIGYTVNTKNAAVSTYENYAFNSMTLIGGKPFGAGVGGIFRLAGDTDDGADIDARLRLGVTNFGTMLGKRVPHAYIGYTSDGSLVLKTITMDRGTKKENWYRMKSRPAGAPAESRFDPAKGLQGVYWGFELVNEDGADFVLDTLQIYPVIINRRYSGR